MEQTCTIKSIPGGKLVEAVIMEFKQGERLLVVLNKSVKLSMAFNGRNYEGRAAGLDFESNGPRNYKEGG